MAHNYLSKKENVFLVNRRWEGIGRKQNMDLRGAVLSAVGSSALTKAGQWSIRRKISLAQHDNFMCVQHVFKSLWTQETVQHHRAFWGNADSWRTREVFYVGRVSTDQLHVLGLAMFCRNWINFVSEISIYFWINKYGWTCIIWINFVSEISIYFLINNYGWTGTIWIKFYGKSAGWKKCFILANEQLAKLLPAMKAEVTFRLEPATMLQGALEHPAMSMDKAVYTEPVTKTWKWVLSIRDAAMLLSRRAETDHALFESESLNNFDSQFIINNCSKFKIFLMHRKSKLVHK